MFDEATLVDDPRIRAVDEDESEAKSRVSDPCVGSEGGSLPRQEEKGVSMRLGPRERT